MKNKTTFNTKLYGVIGNPISHSLSPTFQNLIISMKNIDALYIPLKIKKEDLDNSINILRDNFSGFNVTVPYKEKIIEYLDEIDPLAKKYGAVNTVQIADNKLIGYNTDGFGFNRSLEKINYNLKDKKVLLLGAGGAAKVIAYEIVNLGGKLSILNRNIDRANTIKDSIEKNKTVNINILKTIDSCFDAIINCTPVGMYPDTQTSPLDLKDLTNVDLIYDIIYNPPMTKLLKYGLEQNCKVENGLPMLMYQGLKSFEIWTGLIPTAEEEVIIYNGLKEEIKAWTN